MLSVEYQDFDCEIRPHQYLRGVRLEGDRSNSVAIHGFLDNSMVFTPLFPFLQGHQIDCVDLPGHGQSYFKSDDVLCYTMIDYAIDVIKMIRKQFPDTSVNLIGHSLGAGVSILIASMKPELVNKIVLIDNLAPLTSEADDLVGRLRNFNEALDKNAERRVYQFAEEAIVSRANKGINLDVARALAKRSLLKVDSGYQWHYDKKLTRPTPLRFTVNQVQSIIASIDSRVLYLEAMHALKNHHKKEAKYLIHDFKKIQQVQLEGSHYIHTENPQEVAKLLNDFLD